MSRPVLSLAITVWVSILTFSVQTVSQPPPAGKKVTRMQIIEGPALESATHNSAIIRWRTNTGSSLIEHSVVHYGTDPKGPPQQGGISQQVESESPIHDPPRASDETDSANDVLLHG